MQDPREARIQLATTFRALAFYGLNEGVDNHVTVRCKVMFKCGLKCTTVVFKVG